jgi:hypothetical protein
MTKLLSITATPNAPIACDMTGAQDTLAERLAEYRRLFDHALVSRDSTDDETTFRFAARPGVHEWVLDLVQREAACRPFLSYEVDLEGDQIVWTTTGLGGSEMAILDEFLTGAAAPNESSAALAEHLEARGGVPIFVPATEV